VGFFSKPDVKKPSSPAPAPRPSNPSSPQPAAAATLIGPQAQIKGELISSDTVQIEGNVEGKIKSTKQVVIGEKGKVQAEIEAQNVSIRGKLEGDCVATGKVEITGTGQVYGNISAPRIAVAEGAVFRGASNMTSDQKAPTSKAPVSSENKADSPTGDKAQEAKDEKTGL
jgi:cytoskeletal protein CcmA (bactofilin family)